MIRIGLTQRVEIIESYDEKRDCLDQRWTQLLDLSGLVIIPLANCMSHPELFIESLGLSGFILTGGNDLSFLSKVKKISEERERTEKIILDYAEKYSLPVLGVCRGMQVLNDFFGGEMTAVEGHVARRHKVKSDSGFKALRGYNQVNSFHHWGILPDGLGKGLEAVVFAADDTVEAFYHRDLPWVGIMWHPERENPFNERDLGLIKWLFGTAGVNIR